MTKPNQNSNTKIPKVVVIGGGTGSFVALSGLKKYPIDLTAIVTMMDSGGSSGRLRDELGVLPPGDIRQCLVALATSSKLLRDLFMYRFEEGDLKGHNFGNIFLSSLEKTTGSMEKAITEVSKILRIHGHVVPVTFKKADLCVELIDGKIITGETHIDEVETKMNRARIKKAFLTPSVTANPNALKSIIEADFILIGPGDLYTSIIPNLLVKGIANALKKSKAHKIYVMNLMTKYGQTTHYTAIDHISDLEKYIGKKTINSILLNTKRPTKETLSWYEDFDEQPVIDNLKDSIYSVIKKDLLKNIVLKKSPTDSLKRSIIRHDSIKLAKAVMEIISN
ncbi:MAG TPA: gluconeogenesis factor YvcK family protein [Candidatus Limnocylindrales bacterium]|nr:gluconeogenesis factor YvcK family protein [Candidatus Limnocylindrales bacterium]